MLTSRAHAPGVESPNSATLFRWWVATFVVVNLFVVLLTSFWLTQSRDQNIHMAGVTATNLSKVLERYVLGTVDKIDLGLLAVADEFARQSGRGGIDEKTLEDALARQLSHLPEIESLRIADSRGTVRYGRGVVPGVSIDDRGYFIAARDNPAAGLIISQPVFARITQKWVVVLARRLERADGSFGGVVYANLGIEQLINAFATLDVGPRGSVTLRDGELGVIARYPEPRGPGSTIGNKNVSPEFRSLVQTGNTEGSFAVVSSLDKVERLFSFRRIGRHPLYIIVGLARDDVLAGWHGEVASAAALLAIFIAATTIAGWVFFRVWKRLIESRQQVRAIVETEPECVKVLSLDGTLRDMNRAGLDMIEAESLDQVAGRSVLDIVAPPYRAAFAALGEKVARGEPGELEFEIIGLKGGRRWLETRAVPLRDEWGKITGLLGVTRDVTEKKRTAEALRHGEERLREAQRIAQLGSWELDLATRELTWSEEIYRIFEIDPRKFGASYEAFMAAVHPDDRERVQHAYEISVKNRLPYEITHRLQMADGTVKYVRERCETAYDAEGKPLRSTGTVQDVTLAVLNEEALRESEERFRTIADYTYDWEYWQGPQGEILYMSPSCTRITGYGQGEFIAKPGLLCDIIHADDRHLMDAHLADIHHGDDAPLDFRIVRKDGEVRWIAHGCQPIYAADGRFMGRRASNRDITDRKQAEAQVQQFAYFDTLTGLPNRRMLHDRLVQALSQAKRHERALAIMFLDLDNFKKINDELGHDVGDELLKEVAVRLGTCVRAGDTVARQGGDEFVVVLAEIAHPDDAAFVAEKIIKALEPPVVVGAHRLAATTSIGIAVYPINGTDDIAELMKKADKAMYAAKAAGRNGFRFFDAALSA